LNAYIQSRETPKGETKTLIYSLVVVIEGRVTGKGKPRLGGRSSLIRKKTEVPTKKDKRFGTWGGVLPGKGTDMKRRKI